MDESPAYGHTRPRRAEVTYAQLERAATDILKTGVRPTVESVRNAVGGGSARTILDGLNRYWRDLGNQLSARPDTLRRLPAAVADLADGLWQRALSLATDAAEGTSTEAEGQVARLQSQLDLRQHTLSQREIELDELVRSRERTVKELEDHLRAALSMLTKRDGTIAALESRLNAAHQETEEYRQRLGRVLQRAVTKHQSTHPKPGRKSKMSARAPKRPKVKKATPKQPRKHR